MRVACIQLRSGIDIDANIKAATALIRKAVADGAVLVATPEMTHILQRSPKKLFAAITDEASDIAVQAFSDLAAELNIDLLIGSLAIRTGERRAANRGILFGPDGQIKARYDKIHMFDVTISKTETWKESGIYDAGTRAVMADVQNMRLGMSICYDVRFAALYRDYAQAGAEIMAVPAAFTRPTGRDHWATLLRARAIETGAFVVAPAQGGEHDDGRATWGHSLIVGPWGEIIAEIDNDDPGYVIADLDPQLVIEARRKIPAWQNNAAYTL